jgi:hypothetical protein
VIAGAVRLARATSSTTSALVLVAFNLVPLGGVLFWGWNVATLLILYWVENGVIGVLNVPKMLLARGPVVPRQGSRLNGGIAPANAGLVAFFLIHYGIFWVVHGIFVFILPTIATVFSGGANPLNASSQPLVFPAGIAPFEPSSGGASADWSAVLWGTVALAISHGASFLINFVGRQEYLRVSVVQQMFAPYGRVLILHLTILFGAFISLVIGSPVGAVAVLVIIKTIVDLTFHLREHGALMAAAGAA